MERLRQPFYWSIYDDAREHWLLAHPEIDENQRKEMFPAVDVFHTAASMAAAGRYTVGQFLESTGFSVEAAKEYEAQLHKVAELPSDVRSALALVAKQERKKRA